MTCPRCQQDNPSHANFCLACGVPLRSTGESGPSGTPYAELQRALTEAQEQQTAAGDILRVISGSHTDVQPVFDVIAQSAARLCAADTSIFRVEGERLVFVAHHGLIAQRHGEFSLPLSRGTVGGRSVLESRTVQVADLQQEDREFSSEAVENARRFGFRTILSVPLLREGIAIGGIQLRRTEVEPFGERQVALLQTFAAQAVIAIENVRLFNETKNALEQQTATTEILRVIASSPTDVQPVFDTILASATTLLGGFVASITRRTGDDVHMAAFTSMGESLDATVRESYPVSIDSPNPHSVAIRRCEPHIIADADTQPDIPEPVRRMARARGWRSNLAVPLRRTGMAIGALGVSRRDARDFTPDDIALLQTFADQAVIAIENVRLFNETQEALEQQTATSEILGVVASSPTELDPVFETIVRSAARVCDAPDATIAVAESGEYRISAHYGPIPLRPVGSRFPIGTGTVMGKTILEGRVLHVEDLSIAEDFPEGQRLALELGQRATLCVPLLREGASMGTIMLRRTEAQLFTERQVTLLKTFADQAVIAIENVRLFKELETRNAELTDTLARQMATGEVLRAISQVQTDAQPVFDMIAQSARRLCAAAYGQVQLYDGKLIHLAALESANPEGNEPIRAVYPLRVGDGSAGGRAIGTCAVVQIPDLLDERHPFPFKKVWEASGLRSFLAVPMLRDGEPLGTIGVGRVEPGQFPQTQIDLLQTFAEQAVIAIENVRLFKELEARTQDLTRSVSELQALGEVGQAISSTLDLETVLNTIVSRAVQISGLDGGVVFEYDAAAEEFVQRAMTDTSGALAEARRTTRIRKGEGVLGRTAITLEPVQVADIALPGAYEGRLREILIGSGIRAILAVPMVREGQLIGCLGVTRNQPGEFPTETIELLRTFATQSALAIQNARLFHEIEDKSRQLEAASRHKSEFLANMSHELRTPLNAIIGFSEVLNERMFGELNEKQDEYLKDIYASGQHLLSLINDILDLSKIEAGRMELELAEFSLPVAIDNALILVRERASRRGIRLRSAIDDRVGMIRGDERKVKQVLLNLLSNALKFTPEGGRIDVRAAMTEGMAEISVADTGVGIAPEDQAAIFEEFRQVGTADKKVEGTGLGLALSRKFIELHGGRIWVHSQPGEGSTFSFTLPAG
jgi:GAF domain-containing protein